MKTARLILTLALAWVVIAGSCATQARAGTLSGIYTSSPLAGAYMPIDLTTEGQIDWAYWGFVLPTDFDQKEGATNQIGNYIQIGTNAAQSYGNSESIFDWSDGSSDATATNMTSGIYWPGDGSGYEVDVDADTTPKLFNIYVGAWAATIHFEASLSDGSAPRYVDETFSNGVMGGANRRYSIIYAANSPGQKLAVKVWVLSTVFGNVTLQAASLEPVPSLSVTQPVAYPTNVFAAGTPVTLTVEAQGPFPYSYQWLVNSGSGFVSVPDSNTNDLFVATTNLHGTYSYEVVVTNNSGGAVTSAPITLIAATPTGFLRVGALNLQNITEVNLTVEGTLDWAHWGLTQPTDFDHKAGVTPQIHDYIPIGASLLDYYQFGNNAQGFTWSDGTPDPATNNSTTGLYVAGQGNGFEVDVAAQTTNQVFNIYCGVYTPGGNLATLHMEASLSDGSVPYFIDESVNGIQNERYSMIYAAGSTNQTLRVRYWVIGASDGNVFLQAATLQGGLAVSPPVILPTNTVALGSTLEVTVPETAGPFPYYYQWEVNTGQGFVDIADSNTNTIYVTPPAAGSYTYRVVVTNGFSEIVTSAPTTLTVTPATSTLTVASVDVLGQETIDLTAVGTMDWAAWGLNLPTDFDDKTGVTSQISNYIALGTAYYSGQYGNNIQGFTWTDGQPTSAVTNSTTGIWVSGPEAGYEVDVPATAGTRVLTMYVGAYLATAHFEASLSDGSAPYYVDESFSTTDPNGSDHIYIVTYAAPSSQPAPHLIVRFWQINGIGDVTLSAASLQGGRPILNLQSAAGGMLKLTWPQGILLEATNVAGPWTTNSSPSPYTFAPTGPQMFFRAKVE